jgi:hypothetical protein
LHHVDVDRLRAAYGALNPKAATVVDGLTWREYGTDLEENLRDLHARVHRGGFSDDLLTDECVERPGQDLLVRNVTTRSTGSEYPRLFT